MESKNKGIDSREIKCVCENPRCCEGGISFDEMDGEVTLAFHFLDLIKYGKYGPITPPILHQKTKLMILSKETAQQIVDKLNDIYDLN